MICSKNLIKKFLVEYRSITNFIDRKEMERKTVYYNEVDRLRNREKISKREWKQSHLHFGRQIERWVYKALYPKANTILLKLKIKFEKRPSSSSITSFKHY